jgi:hypothetical protein
LGGGSRNNQEKSDDAEHRVPLFRFDYFLIGVGNSLLRLIASSANAIWHPVPKEQNDADQVHRQPGNV